MLDVSGLKDTDFMPDFTCPKCGKKFRIKFGSWRKDKNKIRYCASCNTNMIYERINSLPKEEKEMFYKKRNDAVRKGWKNQTPEMKKKVSEERSRRFHNPDFRASFSKALSDRWKNMDQVKKHHIVARLQEGREEYWKDEENKNFHSKRARKKWFNQTKEEQERILGALTKGRLDYYKNDTPERKRQRIQKSSESLKRFWKNLSKDEKDLRVKEMLNYLKPHFDSLSAGIMNANESKLSEFLNLYQLKYTYNWYNEEKHPDFDKLFPINPIRKGVYVSPYHAWDFKIEGIDSATLVDIDGSIHDPKSSSNTVHDTHGNEFILYDYIAFKDSQRIYQTDGLDAYVIKCYDDQLSYNTPAVHLSQIIRNYHLKNYY
nr:MAG TPA: zinc-ribbon domain protein [Caudoviricetes sp.]